jgi:hypothetical protein
MIRVWFSERSNTAKSETGGLQAFYLIPHRLIVEAAVRVHLDVEMWAVPAVVVLARASYTRL